MTDYIDVDNEFYPEKLKRISHCPKKLFYKGNISLLKEPKLAIVGTRHLTDYGRRIERKFVKDLALRDIVIVSGMALGADRVAHEETLNNGGKTIAVMGTGFNHIFPAENVDIYKRILEEDGLIITEYEDDVDVKPNQFPQRNRIISGISSGVLVIEAAINSGSGITARLAKEQAKPVFALPGRLDSKYGLGVNRMIQNGAKLVISASDIVNDIDEFKQLNKKITKSDIVKKEYRKIYSILDEEPKTLDEISRTHRKFYPMYAKASKPYGNRGFG